MVNPDQKPGGGVRRIVDPAAVRRATLRRRECAACGEPGANGHHVVEKDDGGDDVDENIVTLCGSGTMGCHGALHGNPYVKVVVEVGAGTPDSYVEERRDREWVARRIGKHLVTSRTDVLLYVIDKLGPIAGRSYLERRYYVDLTLTATRATLPA
jgi:hypothetical protein